MTITVDIQYATNTTEIPNQEQLHSWASSALEQLKDEAELTIRIVDEDEGTELNERWRSAKGPTNVLSFVHEGTDNIQPELLGDIVICAPVVRREAQEQKKELQAHWAHMVIHGVLHLNGFDHVDDDDAEKMEALEIHILEKLQFKNPYLDE